MLRSQPERRWLPSPIAWRQYKVTLASGATATLGFSLDSDSVLISFAGAITDTAGRRYRLEYHNAQISSGELTNAPLNAFYVNTVSSQPVTVNQIETGISAPWRNVLFDLSVRWQDATPFPDRGSEFNIEAGVQLRF